MKKTLFFILILFLLSSVYAECGGNQIDINSASKEELMKITGLGGEGIIAGRVIENRPYNSLDKLLEVKGIGNKTLEKIKSQGLACVAGEVEGEKDNNTKETEAEETENDEETNKTEISSKKVQEMKYSYPNTTLKEDKTELESENSLKVINLTANSQVIKSQDEKENKSNYAVYGLVAFCVLLATLLILKKKKYKNEFR